MSEVTIRPAVKSDAADIALLDNIAGHGISLWFWQREVASGLVEDALAYGRSRLAAPEAFYGVPNAIVAVEDEMILGSVTAYKMPAPDGESEQLKRDAPAFRPLFELFDLCEEHWFVDSLAVYPEARGKGIGTKLLDAALEKGQKQGETIVSLVVEDSNVSAIELYRARGFENSGTRPFVEFQGPAKTKHWLMLTRHFSQDNS